jgi:hypothetical protein
MYFGPRNDCKHKKLAETMIICFFVNPSKDCDNLKLPSKSCYNSKYKQEKLPFCTLIKLADVLRKHVGEILQFAIV